MRLHACDTVKGPIGLTTTTHFNTCAASCEILLIESFGLQFSQTTEERMSLVNALSKI